MSPQELISAIEEERDCGGKYILIAERDPAKTGEAQAYELSLSFLSAGIDLPAFQKKLYPVKDKETAQKILTYLLCEDMAYNVALIEPGRAQVLVDAFFSYFGEHITCYSNSFWNRNEYTNEAPAFGFSGWNDLTDATFNSGIVVYDEKTVGIAWFEDED